MKKLRFFASAGLVACLLGWANGAQAQQEGQSEANSAAQRLAEDLGLSALERLPVPLPSNAQNLAKLVQLGSSNIAEARQNNPGTLLNQAYITQVGFSNEAYLTQNGSGNTTTINQKGYGNKATREVTGDNNKTLLNQIGNKNTIDVSETRSGTDLKVLQLGNKNELRQANSESLPPARYEVEMLGNGIKLSIQNGRIGQ
ncbi:hypothetical protein D0N36_06000 [Hymenobacter lapidiphilus]|uniref:hypothetical protein n=1 Tax=Hymenobacter sp. CCM 8763 TaxID=2303334 RepID=UPI000E34335C|nr:hypothetical protein [Hymenobacter sp. CCM 8763]RFP66019.1 hypothetical protein D0N36_06000 [Hymenobacter sp. CCM 8763]